MGLVGFSSWWKDGVAMKDQRSVRIRKNGWFNIRIMGMNWTIKRIQTYHLVINLADLAYGRDMTFKVMAYDILLGSHYP